MMEQSLRDAGFTGIETIDGIIYARSNPALPEFTATPTVDGWQLALAWPLSLWAGLPRVRTWLRQAATRQPSAASKPAEVHPAACLAAHRFCGAPNAPESHQHLQPLRGPFILSVLTRAGLPKRSCKVLKLSGRLRRLSSCT